MKKNVPFLLLTFFIAISSVHAYDDIPYEANDNSYVVIPSKEYSQEEDGGEFKVFEKVDLKEYAAPSCKEVPLSIDRCISAICVDKEQFGKLYRKVKGKTADNNCEYEERTQGLGGIDCTFPAAKLEQLNKAFQVQFFGLAQTSLSDEEKAEFKKIMDTSCKTVKDSTLTSAVKLNSTTDTQTDVAVNDGVAPAPIPVPDVVIKPSASIEVTLSETSPTSANTEENEKTDETVKNEASTSDKKGEKTFKSVMFTPEEIDQINNILNNFGASAQDFVGQATSTSPKEVSRKFFLSSLIYYTNDKWTVWINNKKISNDKNDEGLSVRDITKEYVVIEWSTPNLESIAPDWRSRLTATSRNKFVSPKKDIEVYLPDETSALVSFKLSPNQLFEVSSMRIKEGDLG